jgi:L-2-hydroxyglutarate oxidase
VPVSESSFYDLVIVGGGIVGLATARALGEVPRLRLAVLEAEATLASHQTGHNSGVIHSGLYYKPGSLKARNCKAGRDELYRFCAERGIRHERCGKVVVAVDEWELEPLAELERRGRANGLAGVRRLGPDELGELEPHVRGRAGLHVPETGIVDYRQVAAAMADDIRGRGHDILTSTRLSRVERRRGELVLATSRGTVRAANLVNCAGLESDRVALLAGLDPGLRIIPFRGDYYELADDRRHLVRNLIYPVPDPRFPFLGVHFTRTVTGAVEAGPNAVLALRRAGYSRTAFSLRDTFDTLTFPGFWRMARRYWRTGFDEVQRSFRKGLFVAALKRLVPELGADDLRPAGCGVRAQAVEASGQLADDFRIVAAERMVHVLNAPSPAATASLAIGRHIADLARRDLALG